MRARNTIEGYVLSLDTAMAEWREARDSRGGSLVEAVLLCQQEGADVPKKMVQRKG